MLSNRLTGYTPIGLIDDDRNKLRYRFQGVKVLGTTADLPEILQGAAARRGAHRAALGRRPQARRRRRDVPRGGRAGQDAAERQRSRQRRRRPRRPAARRPGRGHPRPRARRARPRRRRRLRARPHRARDGRRRLDRLGALPPARAHGGRPARASPTTPRTTSSRSTASCARRRRSTIVARDRRRARRGAHGDDLRAAAAGGRVPRGRLQARAADGAAPRAGAAQQRARARAPSRALAARHGVDRFVLVSTDKAVYPKTAMGASKALAEWVVEALGQVETRDDVRRRALRQRARIVRLGRADLPRADRARRPGDRHRAPR